MRQPAEGTWSILYRISRKKSPASRSNIADGTKRRFGFCRKELYFLGKNFIFWERTLFFRKELYFSSTTGQWLALSRGGNPDYSAAFATVLKQVICSLAKRSVLAGV